MDLAYKAYDKTGKAVDGTVDSSDMMTAGEMLRAQGLFVIEINEAASSSSSTKRPLRLPLKLQRSKKIRNVAVFTRQLCVLVSSGTQMVEALTALERQVQPGPWRDTIADVRVKVEEGASFSEALEDYPGYFDSVYVSLVAAGESSGVLVEMLSRLATLKQEQQKVRNAISGAMIYPSLLMSLGLTMFTLLLAFVVPKFSDLFDSMGMPLPASTQVLVDASGLLRQYWWVLVLGIGGTVVWVTRYLHTDKGRVVKDGLVLKLPCLGRLIKSFAVARIVRLLGVLLAGHVPILKALHLVKNAAGNVRYSELITLAEDHVSRGELISAAFSDASLVDPTVYEAIRSGEQSGQLDQLLLNVADFMEEDNEVILRSLTTILEPVILIIMGLLVGLIAVSMFLPLFDLTAMTQAG
jgi:type II secretory pathway component PulF